VASRWMKFLILSLTALNLLACAERYRDADAGRTSQEVESFLEELRNQPNAYGGGLSQALVMKDDANTDVYFAESYRAGPNDPQPPMGRVEVVTPVDFTDLGATIGINEIQDIRVFFLDQIDNQGGRNYAFIIRITKTNDTNPIIFAWANDQTTGSPESFVDEDGVFHVEFNVGNGKILILESDDTTGGELNKVVQFRLKIDDQSGAEPYDIGQISSMIGYLAR